MCDGLGSLGDGVSDPEMALTFAGCSKHRTVPACNIVGHKQLLPYSNRIRDGTEIPVEYMRCKNEHELGYIGHSRWH